MASKDTRLCKAALRTAGALACAEGVPMEQARGLRGHITSHPPLSTHTTVAVLKLGAAT